MVRIGLGTATISRDYMRFYRVTRSSHILDIATLVDAPDRGEGGLELMDLE